MCIHWKCFEKIFCKNFKYIFYLCICLLCLGSVLILYQDDVVDTFEDCVVPNDAAFPKCASKVRWLSKYWNSHPCYKRFGVDGSTCTLLRFLSEIDRECPLLNGQATMKDRPELSDAELERYDPQILLNQVLHSSKLQWIKDRIACQWPEWISSFKSLKLKQHFGRRRRKHILVFIGVVAERNWDWANSAKKGGPLGELLQWADLIASMFLLGHNVYVATDRREISFRVKKSISPCGDQRVGVYQYDLIYTDIHGLFSLKQAGLNIERLKCRLRILDTFGTEARFNYIDDLNEEEKMNESFFPLEKNIYYDWRLNLKQYMTFFPHSPDNSFLGFAVARKKQELDITQKNSWAVVYGKQNYMWQDAAQYLSVLQKYFDVHGTVAPDWSTLSQSDSDDKMKDGLFNVPGFVHNHGLLSWNNFQLLLQKSKIFVGLGFPFEGPAPLEAISQGAVFLNAKWEPPVGVTNDVMYRQKWFFKGKPTLRKLTSQHPYLESFIGKPYVFTVDIKDSTAVEEALEEILKLLQEKKVKPYLPYEFTHEGMLQRVNTYIEKQNFCAEAPLWPGKEILDVRISSRDESCKEACDRKGLVCDNALFPYLNVKEIFKQYQLECETIVYKKSLIAPSYSVLSKICVLQKEPLLYSCVDSTEHHLRVCPCRDFIKEQITLYPEKR